MTKSELWQIARMQSAVDCACRPEDFLQSRNVIVPSRPHPQARAYLTLPFDCNLVSYGSNVVASVRPDLAETIASYLDRFSPAHCMETPALHRLDDSLQPYGLRTCFMAEYFLPDPKALQPLSCSFELRLLTPDAFAPLYRKEWSNALCEKRKALDVLALGAFDGDRLVGLAGASADCASMWQIGIDVLPAYRRRGIASALTSRLAIEILRRDIVPFYCAAWCNLPSVGNAIRSGFHPAWVELTAKSAAFVAAANEGPPASKEAGRCFTEADPFERDK